MGWFKTNLLDKITVDFVRYPLSLASWIQVRPPFLAFLFCFFANLWHLLVYLHYYLNLSVVVLYVLYCIFIMIFYYLGRT